MKGERQDRELRKALWELRYRELKVKAKKKGSESGAGSGSIPRTTTYVNLPQRRYLTKKYDCDDRQLTSEADSRVALSFRELSNRNRILLLL